MYCFLVLAVLGPQVIFGMLSRDDWPQMGAEITQDLLDQIQDYNELLNKPLSIGFFLRGTVGPQGSTGSKGPPGVQGLSGGYGAPGSYGLQGPFGPQGFSGIRGPRGPPGMRGPKGIPGHNGMPGTAGMPGSRGLPGAVGIPGPPGCCSSQVPVHRPGYTAPSNVTVVCEGDKAVLSCAPTQLVKITQAFWGRDDYHTCAQNPNMTTHQLATEMDTDHVVSTLRNQCANQQACQAMASREIFQDQMEPRVSKYLKVWHECIPGNRNWLGRLRRGALLGKIRKKREFYLPFHDESEEKNPHSRAVEKEGLANTWDKSNKQINKTDETRIEKKAKRQEEERTTARLAHILDELLGSPPLRK